VTLELDIYNFLIKPIRDKDIQEGALFLRRFLQGPQAVWQTIQDKIDAIKDIWNLVDCPDAMLPYLKNILGWTKDLENITSELDSLTLRRLIGASVQLWKTRSNETSLENVLRLIFGKRLRIWNWFDFRIICDETEMGEEREGRDPWLIDLPGTVETTEYWSNIRIVDPGVDQRPLLINIVKLMRAIGERYEITYLKLLDLFEQDGDNTQWNPLYGSVSTVEGGALKLSNPAILECVGSADESSGDWAHLMVTSRVRGTKANFSVYNGFGHFFYGDPIAVSAYSVTVDVQRNLLCLGKSITGFGITFGIFDFSTIGEELLENVWYTIRSVVTPLPGGENQIDVYFDGVLRISQVDSELTHGLVGIFHHQEAICECSEFEVMQLPAESDTVEINS